MEIGAAVELPAFVQAAVKAEDDPQETKVLVMPEWSPDEVDTSADGAADIAGFLPYRYNLSNPLGYEALLTVTVGEGAEEPEPGKEISTAVLEYAIELAGDVDTDGVMDAVTENFEKALRDAEDILERVKAGDGSVTQNAVDRRLAESDQGNAVHGI